MGTASISAGPRLLALGAAGLPLALVVARLELALPQEQHRVRALVLAERDLILERLGPTLQLVKVILFTLLKVRPRRPRCYFQ